MKIELVQPLHANYGNLGIRESRIFTPAQLTMPYLAALCPEEDEVTISDELAGPIAMTNSADLVGITFVTPFAYRAYELADTYRSQGKAVILGGPHASLLPSEAMGHADAVVVGEAESSWPQLLEDFKKGRLKPLYHPDPPSLDTIPHARCDLLKKENYVISNVIQASRGCPFSCDFCTLASIYGPGHRTRPIEEVVREIETFEGDVFIFWDDNIVGSPAYARKLFHSLIPLKKRWLGQSSLTIARDTELLELAAKSGCFGLFIGIESVSQSSLETVRKGFNKVGSLRDDIRRLHDAGIAVLAGMIFGFDGDDSDIFEKTIEVATRAAIDGISFSILTPYPGTPLFSRLEAEGRLLHQDWSKYNSDHVVFTPRNMTPAELQEGHDWANREFYSISSIVKRLWASKTQPALTVRINMANRKYVHDRFPSET